MMGYVALALGLVLVVEGLALALAPSRMEDLLALFAPLPAHLLQLEVQPPRSHPTRGGHHEGGVIPNCRPARGTGLSCGCELRA